jgi:hypothetical protein
MERAKGLCLPAKELEALLSLKLFQAKNCRVFFQMMVEFVTGTVVSADDQCGQTWI